MTPEPLAAVFLTTPVIFAEANGRRCTLASLVTSGEPVGDAEIVATPEER
ncbi:unannotated protein [freshwater metagenome]|uniref:Unannotated protein n=1 Tax=freshwater metagenome TaxID=449393 RepID=A0A6J6T8L8_9ZZZZ